jgi:hypothetical protein
MIKKITAVKKLKSFYYAIKFVVSIIPGCHRSAPCSEAKNVPFQAGTPLYTDSHMAPLLFDYS